MFILQTGLSTSTGSKKALHVNRKVTLTVNGNFCSSMSRYEHDRSFLLTPRDGLHWLTYIHYDGEEARMRRTPRHRHAKQLHERPNYQVHTYWQYTGQVILAQFEGSRQTLSDRQSNLWHPLTSSCSSEPRKTSVDAIFYHSNLCMSLHMRVILDWPLHVSRGAAAKLVCASLFVPVCLIDRHFELWPHIPRSWIPRSWIQARVLMYSWYRQQSSPGLFLQVQLDVFLPPQGHND